MPIRNIKKFGLALDNKLSDLQNSDLALKSLNLTKFDLDVIFESSSNSVTYDDFRSFSRLSVPLWKTLHTYFYESKIFEDILLQRAGVDGMLFGNLDIGGRISGSAIRYRYLDGFGTGRIGSFSVNSGAGAQTGTASRTQGIYYNVPTSTQVTFSMGSTGNSRVISFGDRYRFRKVATSTLTFSMSGSWSNNQGTCHLGVRDLPSGQNFRQANGTRTVTLSTNLSQSYEVHIGGSTAQWSAGPSGFLYFTNNWSRIEFYSGSGKTGSVYTIDCNHGRFNSSGRSLDTEYSWQYPVTTPTIVWQQDGANQWSDDAGATWKNEGTGTSSWNVFMPENERRAITVPSGTLTTSGFNKVLIDNDTNNFLMIGGSNQGVFKTEGGQIYWYPEKWTSQNTSGGDGKALFNVTIAADGSATILSGNSRGNAFSNGNTVTLSRSEIGGTGAANTAENIVLNVTSIHDSKKIADISTSRVSAWSSSDPRATSTNLIEQAKAKISYGARIGIRSTGKLRFGNNSGYQWPVTGGDTTSSNILKLQTSLVPSGRIFDQEIPTTKIKCNINGRDVELYAMKGIPVVFRGFFRNINGYLSVSSIAGLSTPSWRVVRVGYPSQYANYTNTTAMYYRSTVSRERDIEIYYYPDKITELNIRYANISEIPAVKFASMTSFDMYYNNLRDFPDLSSITPNLTNLQLSRNPFYLAEEEGERRFNQAIADKIPATLRHLYLHGCFYGSIEQNILSKYTNLLTFDVGRGGGPYFHSDSITAELPNIPASVETYSVQANDFRSIFSGTPPSGLHTVKTAPKLKNLNLSSNYYLTNAGFTEVTSPDLYNFNIYSTGLPFPNLSNKIKLVTVTAYWTRNFGTFFYNGTDMASTATAGTYKLNACTSLENIQCYAAGVSGEWPVFTNPALRYLDVRYTSLSGGGGVDINNPTGFSRNSGGPNGKGYAIPPNILTGCPNLHTFYCISWSFATDSQIGYDVFQSCPDLTNLYIYTGTGGIGGAVPNLSGLSKLTNVYLWWNRFSGSVPALSGASNLYYIGLQGNRFTGTVPGYANLPNAHYIYLHNNAIQGLSDFGYLPNLRRFYCHNNQLVGNLPRYGGTDRCYRLEYLLLYNNQLTGYTAGALTELPWLRYLDVSNNQFTQSALNSLVDDLFDNYENYNRGGVTINIRNIRNNGAIVLPGEDQLDKIDILQTKGWTWRVN